MNDKQPGEFESEQPTLPPALNELQDHPTIAPSGSDCSTESGIGREFGDYLLEEEIARGGMGVVYRATQKSLKREVAIKMILAGQFASKEEVDRFYSEATAAAKLDHPNIVPVFEVGEIAGNHFFSMKLIGGSDFGKRLADLREDLTLAVSILKKVCDAVHHAHQRGILHRDLKPGNILLDQYDEPFVADLGLARTFNEDSNLTQTGAVIGTPSYMPPEQAKGSGDITTAADVYSLGAILYEILCGRPPFVASSPVETMMQVISDPPERPSALGATDRALESICLKCLAKNQQERYDTAAELSRDLERWLNGDPVSLRPPSLVAASKYWLRQNFGSAIWAILIGPMLGVVSSLSLWYSTIGSDTSFITEAFGKLPSAKLPTSLWIGVLPAWTQIPLLVLFLLSTVFIGYVTVSFVKPKQRGADLAAGTIVGLTASLAAFMFALGPICILTLLSYNDLSKVNSLARFEPGKTPEWLLETYPELSEMARADQINALTDKMEAEHFIMLSYGLWLGALVSLSIYFLPCLYETAVAGPLSRLKKPWFQNIASYLELTFPAVTLMTIASMAAMTWLVFGAIGFRWTIRLALILGMSVMVLVAAKRNWTLPYKLGIQALFIASFLWFFAIDFPSIPTVCGGKVQIVNAESAVKRSPTELGPRINSISARLNFAASLKQNNRASEGVGLLNSAIAKADQLDRLIKEGVVIAEEQHVVHQMQFISRYQKMKLLEQLGKNDKANEMFDELQRDYPAALNEENF